MTQPDMQDMQVRVSPEAVISPYILSLIALPAFPACSAIVWLITH